MDHEKYSRKCPTTFKGVQPVRFTITRVGKVVYLATSDPSLEPANWILERDATHAAHPHRHIYDRDGNLFPSEHKIWKSESIHGQFLQRGKDT